MKTDMRRHMARQPFEEKIRKVGQFIKLSATVKSSRVREEAPMMPHFLRTHSNTGETSVKSKL
jgi:hypothetical protein